MNHCRMKPMPGRSLPKKSCTYCACATRSLRHRFPGQAPRALALVLLAALAAPAAAAKPPPEPLSAFSADYRVTNGTIRLGTTTVSLQPEGDGWRYHSVTEASGLLALFVSGQAVDSTRLEPHGDWFRPLEYVHREPDEEDNVEVAFDWDAGQATARGEDGTRQHELDADTMDGFAATLSMIRAVAAGRKRFQVETIDDEGEAETLRFRVIGQERLGSPYGEFDTIRVERVRKKKKKRETITWLAPELDWIALRIEQREDGDLTGRLELTDIAGREAPERPPREPGATRP